MDAVFSFLFSTREGFGVLFVCGIILFALAAFILEKRTSQLYVDRGEEDEESWLDD